MFIQSCLEPFIRRRRVIQSMKEPHCVLTGEHQCVMSVDGFFGVFHKAQATMKALTVLPSTDAARSIRCLAEPLSRRLMRSVLAVLVCIMIFRSSIFQMYVVPVPLSIGSDPQVSGPQEG